MKPLEPVNTEPAKADSLAANIAPANLPAVAVPGLYVHFPFCFHKCDYCDFYSVVGRGVDEMEAYVDRLLAEATFWTSGTGPALRPQTVFFGGGTPSLLPARTMRRLIEGLAGRFDLGDAREWTVEANPATIDAAYLGMLRDLGVNRLSLGAQSFDESELRMLDRQHRPEEVAQTLQAAREAGLVRLSLDLIFGICGQTIESWQRTLRSALALGTEHLSCYGLTYEPGTPLWTRRQAMQVRPVAEETELQMLHLTRRILTEAGLAPYEISNYARSGAECAHNLLYWNGGNYIGLGPSAASHVEGWRWTNCRSLQRWDRAVAAGQLAADEVEHLSPLRRAGELAMLQLRLARGVDFEDFAARTGQEARRLFAQALARMSQLGMIACDEQGFRLTESGIDKADTVAAEFLWDASA